MALNENNPPTGYLQRKRGVMVSTVLLAFARCTLSGLRFENAKVSPDLSRYYLPTLISGTLAAILCPPLTPVLTPLHSSASGPAGGALSAFRVQLVSRRRSLFDTRVELFIQLFDCILLYDTPYSFCFAMLPAAQSFGVYTQWEF
jgi:hypothetical protein